MNQVEYLFTPEELAMITMFNEENLKAVLDEENNLLELTEDLEVLDNFNGNASTYQDFLEIG